MAIDINKKFLYINRDITSGEMDEALCFPVSSFIGAETQTSSLIDLYFKGSKGTDATVVRIVHEQHGLIKTFYTNLVNEINFGEEAFINIYDHARRNTFPSDISFNISTDVQPTFTLQDTDFIVADSISIGGHSVNDIDITNEFVDSDEHLMTSKAINARIAAAGGGVSVSDSTANTDFPVVFHDESNNLHDDTGAFTYNPSSGNLTMPGNLTVNGTDHLIQSDQSVKPVFELKNTSSGNGGPELRFNKQIGTGVGSSATDLGTITFVGDDSAGNEHTYFTIAPEVEDATDGDEAGRVTFSVATSDGSTSTLQSAFYAQGSASANDVDVTLGKGTTSITTVAGGLADGTLFHGRFELGHASDTTFNRDSAGVVSIQNKQIVTAGAVGVASGSQAPIALQIARRTITTAEANAMNSTPIELIPAQGANTIIEVANVIARADRAATQTNSALTMDVHYADKEPGTYGSASLAHFRRFMYNKTTDIVERRPQNSTVSAVTLTEDVNKAVEVSFSSAATTNCFTSLDIYVTYFVIDIS